MHQITTEKLTKLQATHRPPCVSLYQPTHRRHPDNAQDPIRYRNLLVKMESSLSKSYPKREVQTYLKQFQALAQDDVFWKHRTDGLAIFCSPERFEILELQRPVRELLILSDSFHTNPLIRVLQSADRYQVLCLSRHNARLYEGNRDALDLVELTEVPSTSAEVLGIQRSPTTQMVGSYGARASGGGTAVHHGHGPLTDPVDADTIKFFRAVDRGILEQHSRASGLPLMLAALPEYHQPFRQISQNPYLMNDGIVVNPHALSVDALREQAWDRVEPIYLARLERLKEEFLTALSQHAGSADLSDAAKAAVAGRVGTLLVEADRVVPGALDRTSGSIRPSDQTGQLVGDMLDDLAELVIAKGGEVVVVPAERMPTVAGLAATYRF